MNITLDRYSQLLPGSARIALGLLNEFLEKQLARLNRASRLKARRPTGESAR